MFGIDDAIIGAGISGIASYFGGQSRNQAQAEQANSANEFSAKQFATRYQTTTADMQAAGLNPMLAYSQGGGSPPTGQQASVSDAISPAVESARSSYAVGNQAKLIGAQVEATKASAEASSAQAAKTRAETELVNPLAAADIDFKHSSAGSARQNIEFLRTQASKIIEEIKNIPLEGDRLKALVRNLASSADLLDKQGLTEIQKRVQMEALARKTFNEADLSMLDVKSATDFSNIGRDAAQIKPILDLLKHLFPSRR
ncbi:MAG: DNA pilot protein [Microvirus sp.]|nr:MAG: DNA pilot protein [Microvirus sp.]